MRLKAHDEVLEDTEYFTQIISGRMESDRVYAMLPLRPNLAPDATLPTTSTIPPGGVNAMFAGSIDSLGNYYWGAFQFDSNMTTRTSLDPDPSLVPVTETHFELTWYAD
jgi:hypothetical protein